MEWDRKTVLDSWRASLAPQAPANASSRPVPRAPAARGSTVARRVVRRAEGATGTDVDFAIERLIGSGGMGMVYLASQRSLNRTVALKTLAAEKTQDTALQASLREEALIAGQLDHPNIVPVYDLAIDEQGRLFYTMKQVRGHTWSGALPRQPLEERLGIFQRVCDAIAFAHSRGVIHRDLKPSNIMLGAFGEVTVMDWGVACTVRGVGDPNELGDRAALCGTPAYMPPEMARGDMTAVGFASDIYLLGAILYELLEERPPRGDTDALACVEQAADNFIEPPRRDDELTRVAMRAMSARPGDRFASVPELQAAVRECVAHLESIRLARSAEDASREGETTGAYPAHARAIFGFEQSLARWPGNEAARAGMSRARMAYARCARGKGDYELALTQLDAGDPAHARERTGVEAELAAHRLRRRRLRLFVRATAGLAATLAIGAAVFGFVVRGKQAEILQQKSEIAQRLEETRRSDRAGLITLLRSQYAAGEHEGAATTALRLREEYGFDFNAQPDLRQMVRESVWMNPWRATVETGLKNPLRLILAADSADLHVIGENEIAVVDLKSLAVRRRIPLPSPSPNAELVQVGAGGSLWCARGMDILRHDGTNWVPVVRNLILMDPRMFSGFEFARGWFPSLWNALQSGFPGFRPPNATPHAITGLLVSHDDHRLAVGIDGEFLACRESEREGWKFTAAATRIGAAGRVTQPRARCLIRDVHGGPWIAWRPAHFPSVALVVETAQMTVSESHFNRRRPFMDLALRDDPDQLIGMTTQGTLYLPNIESAIPSPHEWPTVQPWQTPLAQTVMTAVSPRRMLVALGGRDGKIWMGRPWPDRGPHRVFRPAMTDAVALAVNDDEQVYALSGDGQVRQYDLHYFTPQMFLLPFPIQTLHPTAQPRQFLAWASDAPYPLGLIELEPERGDQGNWTTACQTTPRGMRGVSWDPRGEYIAMENEAGVWIYSLRDHTTRKILHWPDYVSDLHFTADGTRLAVGGHGNMRFTILERDSWKSLNSIQDLFGAWISSRAVDGVPKFFLAGADKVTRFDAATGRLEWSRPTGHTDAVLMHSVPPGLYEEPPAMWVQSYNGEFSRLSLRDGALLGRQDYWYDQRIYQSSASSDGLYSAFVFPPDHEFFLVWKGDMLPLTDDLLGGRNCTHFNFSSDGRALAVVNDGHVSLIPLPGADHFARLEPVMSRLFGADCLEARAGRTAADHGKETP